MVYYIYLFYSISQLHIQLKELSLFILNAIQFII